MLGMRSRYKEGRLIVLSFTEQIGAFFVVVVFHEIHEALSDSFKMHLCQRKGGMPRVKACKTQCTTTGLMENKACIT